MLLLNTSVDHLKDHLLLLDLQKPISSLLVVLSIILVALSLLPELHFKLEPSSNSFEDFLLDLLPNLHIFPLELEFVHLRAGLHLHLRLHQLSHLVHERLLLSYHRLPWFGRLLNLLILVIFIRKLHVFFQFIAITAFIEFRLLTLHLQRSALGSSTALELAREQIWFRFKLHSLSSLEFINSLIYLSWIELF